eukprot:COSAG06_NODE_7791_length_2373_cov_1.778804_4_plen_35_part_01
MEDRPSTWITLPPPPAFASAALRPCSIDMPQLPPL